MTSKRGEQQRLIDQNRPLMDACSQVAHDLFLANRAKAIYLWVADHAETINKANFGPFFGLMQDFALTEMFVCVGRAFDDARFGDTVCIKRILEMLSNSNLIDRERLLQYLPKNRALARLSDADLLERGVQIISRSRPTPKTSPSLKRVLEVRHTRVAHRSANNSNQSHGPTFDDVDECLSWAKEFIGMVGHTFGNHVFKYDNGEFWDDYGVKSSVMSIRRLAHKAGVVIDPRFAETERLAAQFAEGRSSR